MKQKKEQSIKGTSKEKATQSKSNKKEAKKIKKLMRKKAKNNKVKIEKQYIEDALPVIARDPGTGAFVMDDGTLFDMFAVITKDLNSASDDELLYDKYLWEKLFKTYADDIKIIGLYFHPDTSEQVAYINSVLSKTKSPVMRRVVEEKRDELIFVSIDSAYMEMQFYLIFYARNKVDYKDKCIALMSLLNQGLLPSIEKIDSERKEQIIYQIFNKNMRGDK